MAAEFSSCVDYGLRLSKRIYYGKGSLPFFLPPDTKSSSLEYLPSAPMVYAEVPEPHIVDNPDVPSYQPYVHGRVVPPPLIPLNMHDVSMEIDCRLDTAFVVVSGTWRVHCVMAGKGCDCRIAVPMGEQGSLLGVEVGVDDQRSFSGELITDDEAADFDKVARIEDGKFLKGRIYTFRIPKVDGGSNLSLKISWSQKIVYLNDQFCLSVPFNFPTYVTPTGKKITKREKIVLNVDSGIGTEVLCGNVSHPLKELRRQVGQLSFRYEAEVKEYSAADFSFSFSVWTGNLHGGVLLQSPSLHDLDQREMFCLYVFPGLQAKKVFKKNVVLVIDKSGSMRGGPLEGVKNALCRSLSLFSPEDSFNIILFDDHVNVFSSRMERATKEAISKATQWININLIASGGTNIMLSLQQAMKLLDQTSDSIPVVFLVTDGAVRDEREICNMVKDSFNSGRKLCPRISTFGVGTYCNHYFLQTLAHIGLGTFDASPDIDLVEDRLQRLLSTASSIVLANITMTGLEHLGSLELFPFQIPDLSSRTPLIASGRYNGSFPDSFKLCGTLADMSKSAMVLKAHRAKNFPLDRVLARRQIDIMTSKCWFLESKELEEKVKKMSKASGVPSEYTRMILVLKDRRMKAPEPVLMQDVYKKLSFSQKPELQLNGQTIVFLGSLGFGFGNLVATLENIEAGTEIKQLDATDMVRKAASDFIGRVADRVCCMCLLQACAYTNDRCAVAFTQLCSALACFACVSCCFDLCS